MNLKAYTFINRADPRGQDNDDAAEVLKETEALTFIDAPLVHVRHLEMLLQQDFLSRN